MGFAQRADVRIFVTDSRHAEDAVDIMIHRKMLGGPQVSPSDGNSLTDSAEFPGRFVFGEMGGSRLKGLRTPDSPAMRRIAGAPGALLPTT